MNDTQNSHLTGLLRSLGFLLISMLIASGCGSQSNLYRVANAGWLRDSIQFTVVPIDTGLHVLPSDIDVSCLSCNMANSYWSILLDSTGTGRLLVDEANRLVTARLRMKTSRLDTTVVIKERTPKDAAAFYKLREPLIGRVLLVQFSMLYADSLQSHGVSSADASDELNLFAETHDFYLVEHPNFTEPLYLLKRSAVRLY